jgi:hypothetical protein
VNIIHCVPPGLFLIPVPLRPVRVGNCSAKFIGCIATDPLIDKGHISAGGIMHRRLSWNATIFFLSMCPFISIGQVLDVPEVIQEQDQWCWAAVSSCVLNYYGAPISQCAIADFARTHATWHDFGSVSCCEDPKKKCNYWNYNYGYPGSIQTILKEWGIENYGTGTSLTIATIKTELGAGRPFIIRWATQSGGHFIVGHGIADSTIYIMDPWFGEGYKIENYKWVLSHNGDTWAGTNVMTTNRSSTAVIAQEKRSPAILNGCLMKDALLFTYNVSFTSQVDIRIYTLRGELLRTVCNGFHHAGLYSKRIEGLTLSSGNYLLSISAGNYRATAMMFHTVRPLTEAFKIILPPTQSQTPGGLLPCRMR